MNKLRRTLAATLFALAAFVVASAQQQPSPDAFQRLMEQRREMSNRAVTEPQRRRFEDGKTSSRFPSDANKPGAKPGVVRADSPALDDLSRWLGSSEFAAFVSDPSSVLSKAGTEDHYSAASVARARDWAIEHLPPEIKANRVTDAAALARLRQKLQPLFDRFPVASRLEIVLYRDDARLADGRVYDAPFVALAEKVLLVLSVSAADKYTPAELRAVVSHELGHLPRYDEYAEAQTGKDPDKLRVIELQADALGMVLSAAVGDDPDTLYRAVKVQYEYLQRFGLLDAERAKLYPTLSERDAVRKLVSKMLQERPKPDKP